MAARKGARRTRLFMALAVAALVVPVSYSAGQGIHETSACAAATCCMEFNSICTYNGTSTVDYYLAIGGKCWYQQGPTKGP